LRCDNTEPAYERFSGTAALGTDAGVSTRLFRNQIHPDKPASKVKFSAQTLSGGARGAEA